MSLSRRYAKALLEIAQKVDQIEATATRLDELEAAFRDNAELQEILRNPMYVKSKRRSIFNEILKVSQTPEHLTIFLDFVFDKDRLEILPDLTRVFRRLADEQAGVLRGEVTTAAPLAAEQQKLLQAALNSATGQQVSLRMHQDAALLGGAVARVGDVVFDGSVRTQLREMKSALLGE